MTEFANPDSRKLAGIQCHVGRKMGQFLNIYIDFLLIFS